MDGGDGDGRVRMEYSCLFRGSLDGLSSVIPDFSGVAMYSHIALCNTT